MITKDVPPGALGIARERQRNIEGYTERRKEREAAPDSPETGADSAVSGAETVESRQPSDVNSAEP